MLSHFALYSSAFVWPRHRIYSFDVDILVLFFYCHFKKQSGERRRESALALFTVNVHLPACFSFPALAARGGGRDRRCSIDLILSLRITASVCGVCGGECFVVITVALEEKKNLIPIHHLKEARCLLSPPAATPASLFYEVLWRKMSMHFMQTYIWQYLCMCTCVHS